MHPDTAKVLRQAIQALGGVQYTCLAICDAVPEDLESAEDLKDDAIWLYRTIALAGPDNSAADGFDGTSKPCWWNKESPFKEERTAMLELAALSAERVLEIENAS
jgi:hypothetical protein